MKSFFAIALVSGFACHLALAQDPPPASAPDAVKKPEIKDLIALPAFTNASGMVMVKISPTLWVGKYEVTQGEYQKVTGSNPSKFAGANHPVDSVSWNTARAFCEQMTTAEKKEEMLPPGFNYSLPAEADWESFVGGATLKESVTSDKTSQNSTAPVGSLAANSLGLHDIRGNLWEFTLDPQDKPYRVLRGGAWNTSYEPQLRLEFRLYADGPDDAKQNYGFRCVLVPETAK